MKKETKDILLVIGVIILIGGITFLITYQMGIKPTSFCESKGYDYYHTNTEKGYIACCSNILENHIKTDETICEAFKR